MKLNESQEKLEKGYFGLDYQFMIYTDTGLALKVRLVHLLRTRRTQAKRKSPKNQMEAASEIIACETMI